MQYTKEEFLEFIRNNETGKISRSGLFYTFRVYEMNKVNATYEIQSVPFQFVEQLVKNKTMTLDNEGFFKFIGKKEEKIEEVKENKYTRKDDKGKTRWDLVDLTLVEGIPRVLGYGLEKYGKKDSWKTIEDAEDRYVAAMIRHLTAYRNCEKVDEESGLSHLDHVLTNAYFLKEFE